MQHGDAIRNTKCAGHLVGDNDDRHLECLPEKQNQLIEFGGNDWIEAGRGFIQNQNLGVEGQGAGHGPALLHAARKLSGMQLAKVRQSHDGQFHPDHQIDDGRCENGVLAQRQGDVLFDGERIEQCCALKSHTDGMPNLPKFRRRVFGDVNALDDYTARLRTLQAENLAQERGLPRTAAAQQNHGFAGRNIEIETVQNSSSTAAAACAVCAR